eukprot:4063357-Pleurochrysis_carterae.AAC.2
MEEEERAMGEESTRGREQWERKVPEGEGSACGWLQIAVCVLAHVGREVDAGEPVGVPLARHDQLAAG